MPFRTLLVTFLLAVLVHAQTGPLLRIEVSGATLTQPDEIGRASGLTAGQTISKEAIQQAAERIMATGKFERVDYRWKSKPSGIVLTFTVREKPVVGEEPAPAPLGPAVKQIVFTGNKVISSERLTAALTGVVDNRPYDAEDFQQVLDSLLRPLYLVHAHWSVKFTSSTTPIDGGGVRVDVAVDEGPTVTLTSVDVEGADRKYVADAPFPVGAPATNQSIQTAIGRVRANLERDGYLKSGIIAREVVGGSELRLTLKIEPGSRFTFKTLQLHGLNPGAEERARKLWTLKPGAPMNPEAVETFIKDVITKHIYVGSGARRELQIVPDTTQVDVVVTFK